jgi:hypothetical protein
LTRPSERVRSREETAQVIVDMVLKNSITV